MFIAMDPPTHTVQRKSIEAAMGPANIDNLEPMVRRRTAAVLDALPRNEPIDFVAEVSNKLTAMMLGSLFDMPREDALLLPGWTDRILHVPGVRGPYKTKEEQREDLREVFDYFAEMWSRKAKEAPKFDLISMLVHNPNTQAMSRADFEGNLRLLIVAGNDTTRNSMTSGLIALKQFPDEFEKLKKNPDLIGSMVPEILRWHTPAAHMRRTATRDYELRGKTIRKGDKVVMWYLSGNFDEEKIENADQFIIDRKRPRQHLSFGFGLHRCLGNRIAEMQLQILWEEFLKRFDDYEIVAEPVLSPSNFVRGIEQLMIKLPV